jgi:hypothetical protein
MTEVSDSHLWSFLVEAYKPTPDEIRAMALELRSRRALDKPDEYAIPYKVRSSMTVRDLRAELRSVHEAYERLHREMEIRHDEVAESFRILARIYAENRKLMDIIGILARSR